MSVIAIREIPVHWSILDVVKAISKLVAGPFEALNFKQLKSYKICYVRLSERLDPAQVVQRINSATIKGRKFTAHVSDTVPDLPVSDKRKKLSKKLRDKHNIPDMELPHEVIINTHHEVFLELQYRYPGLYNLSKKTGHKLLDDLAEIIGDRLKQIMELNPETRESCFQLSRQYRKTHPHFGDFQMILSTLHRLQDASGAPRAQILESSLLPPPHDQLLVIDDIPVKQVKEACNKYCERIAAALRAHVGSLECEPSAADTEELVARKKVREELNKLLPYMPAALRQLVTTHFIPEEPPFHKVVIYGEPFLPAREAMHPFTRRYNTVGSRVIRSRRMYNLLSFKVGPAQLQALRAMDATVINGAKLTIRSDIPRRPAPASLRSELAAYFGGPPPEPPVLDEDEDLNMEWQE